MSGEDDDGQPTYRFRFRDYDVDRYVEECKARATLLRRQAAILTTRAEAIEDEADRLKCDLEKVDPPS